MSVVVLSFYQGKSICFDLKEEQEIMGDKKCDILNNEVKRVAYFILLVRLLVGGKEDVMHVTRSQEGFIQSAKLCLSMGACSA